MSNEMNNTRKSLRDRAKEFEMPELMTGREKGETEEILGTVYTITDYGFLTNPKGEPYAVFTVKERPKQFFFGGTVLTNRLMQLDAEGYRDTIVKEGLPVLMNEKKSRNNLSYTNVIFYPED